MWGRRGKASNRARNPRASLKVTEYCKWRYWGRRRPSSRLVHCTPSGSSRITGPSSLSRSFHRETFANSHNRGQPVPGSRVGHCLLHLRSTHTTIYRKLWVIFISLRFVGSTWYFSLTLARSLHQCAVPLASFCSARMPAQHFQSAPYHQCHFYLFCRVLSILWGFIYFIFVCPIDEFIRSFSSSIGLEISPLFQKRFSTSAVTLWWNG